MDNKNAIIINSAYESAAILTIDGVGEWTTTSLKTIYLS